MGRKPKNEDQNAGAPKAPVSVSGPTQNVSASDLLKEKLSEKATEKSSPKKNHVSNLKKFDKFK